MRFSGICKLVAAGGLAVTMMAAGPIQAQAGDTVLKPAEMQKLMPASVFYRGQTAPTELRNSGGVKLADGFYVLAALVDTSGYTTGVQSKYQACFITEVPIKLGGENLAAGVYGAGFVGDKFVVTDVGGARRAHSECGRRCGNETAHALAGRGCPGRRIPALCRAQICYLQPVGFWRRLSARKQVRWNPSTT